MGEVWGCPLESAGIYEPAPQIGICSAAIATTATTIARTIVLHNPEAPKVSN